MINIYAVGIGPGNENCLTPQAREVIVNCDVVVGYTPYLELMRPLLDGKEIVATGMKSEIARCENAIALAISGKHVAVVSSGDSGIYGMAALLLEMTANDPALNIIVIPGMTAAIAAASVLGAPLSNDFAVISLSDLLTPWNTIEKRLNAAAFGDFVICLYNPQSRKRADYLHRACEIILKHRPSKTWCGVVRNALRAEQEHKICTLQQLTNIDVDMLTTVIIGNSDTVRIKDQLVTKRGYLIDRDNVS